ncbi:TlpA family protein disulfide reductase [Desulfovibrio mangrovi]|uniref:TlpA family protein disulfide reductase n=1 Tax=Desulfovibrio mangrovi TaxID=2976983 RepID=UPI002245B75D|nr:TlpA disulfide reductase family protein [Desulfovibrio mangrovi]UZP68939.1 TlpA family protein disulfide reductase [Desulfovibrio mangrovi]
MTRKTPLSLLLALLLLLTSGVFSLSTAAQNAAEAPQTGTSGEAGESTDAARAFPNLLLPAIADSAKYGLPPKAVQLGELQEEFIIINIYSWFCAPCQAEGPDLRELAELIGPAGTDGTIRIIGIAAGDDSSLTKRFRKKHNLSYALFPDPSLALHGLMLSPPVPTFYVVRNTTDGPKLLGTHIGAIQGKAKEFYDNVMQIVKKTQE